MRFYSPKLPATTLILCMSMTLSYCDQSPSGMSEPQSSSLNSGPPQTDIQGGSEDERSRIQQEAAQLALEREQLALERERIELENARRIQEELAQAEAAEAERQDYLAGPSESEMRDAFAGYIDAMNAQMAEQARAAQSGGFNSNNPLSALQALGGAVMGDAQIRILNFEKVGGTRAPGSGIYEGEFRARLTVDGQGFFAQSQREMWESLTGELLYGKFTETENGWEYEPYN